MIQISYARHRLPPATIQHAVWLYFRFALSYRDVEDLLAERGDPRAGDRRLPRDDPPLVAEVRDRVCQAAPRQPPCALGTLAPRRGLVRIQGRIHDLWRTVDDEGEVLEVIVQPRRDRRATLKLLRKRLKRQAFAPEAVITDRPRSYDAALREISLSDRHVTGGRSNNRAEVSHQSTRESERRRRGFSSLGSAQRFLSAHAAVYNHFNIQRHPISHRTMTTLRAHALATWRQVVAA